MRRSAASFAASFEAAGECDVDCPCGALARVRMAWCPLATPNCACVVRTSGVLLA